MGSPVAASVDRTKFEPMKPAPPVTSSMAADSTGGGGVAGAGTHLVHQAPRLANLRPVGLEHPRDRVLHAHPRPPVQVAARVGDVRDTVLHVLIALTVVLGGAGLD